MCRPSCVGGIVDFFMVVMNISSVKQYKEMWADFKLSISYILLMIK